MHPGSSMSCLLSSLNANSPSFTFAMPARRPSQLESCGTVSKEELKIFIDRTGVKLGPLIPTQADRIKVMKLLYRYEYLNSLNLSDLPATNLIVHRVQLATGITPHSVPQQRLPPHMEW